MRDLNWDLINGDVAHEIEYLNYSNQINVLEAAVKFILHVDPIYVPEENFLQELHRTGTLFLLEKPGKYREVNVVVSDQSGHIAYEAPDHANVNALMDEFFLDLKSSWNQKTPIEIFSYCLWRINWVHPFKNGNGRTARAFSYLCICLKYRLFLPGQRTLIDLIMEQRNEYSLILRNIDVKYEKNKTVDLTQMNNFVEILLRKQLDSIEDDILP